MWVVGTSHVDNVSLISELDVYFELSGSFPKLNFCFNAILTSQYMYFRWLSSEYH